MMMNWPNLVKKYRLAGRVTGVLHCGAHRAEEAADYTILMPVRRTPVWWVEANPKLLPELECTLADFPGQRLIHALLGPVDGEELTLNLTGPYTGSSSVLEFGTHPTFSPDVKMVGSVTMTTRSIDSLVKEHGIVCNMLVMDLQGFEGPVLKGAAELLPQIDFVMSEINCKEVYKGCTRVETLDAMLTDFVRVETLWQGEQGWGDGLWVRRML
jgi:FkbM family methyltransferase